MNVGMFEFQIQILLFYSTKSFDTCVVTRNSCIQVCLTKFTFVKIKSKENFGDVFRIFLEGLSPFKIHRILKFESVPKFIT
jgi:hypothetical protein